MSRLYVLALLPLVAGCWVTQGDYEDALDPDGDDHGWEADCDNTNADVHPGAEEICDGVDNNCDGEIDEGLPQTTYYMDVDGDGFGMDAVTVEACSAPEGFAEQGGDCDDVDAGAFPGATEACDEVDQDCDGVVDEDLALTTYYLDSDRDGFGDSEVSLEACRDPGEGYAENDTDCDDSEASVYPGAPEICNDRLFNDCDASEESALAACRLEGGSLGDHVRWEGLGSVHWTGHAVAGVGDTNGDGFADMLIGAPYDKDAEDVNDHAGLAFLVLGRPSESEEPLASGRLDAVSGVVRLNGEYGADSAGWDVSAAGDFDNDGLDDLLVGARKYDDRIGDSSALQVGVVYLVWGRAEWPSELSLGDAGARLQGTSHQSYLGSTIDSAGDVNGDGVADIIIGDDYYEGDQGQSHAGAAHIILGSGARRPSDVELRSIAITYSGSNQDDRVGVEVSGGGDLNGDGASEVLIGAWDGGLDDPQRCIASTETDPSDCGVVYVVWGVRGVTPVGGLVDDLGTRLHGEQDGTLAAEEMSAAGDVDGDGYGDFLVGNEAYPLDSTRSGAAYLILGGSVDGPASLSADAVIVGDEEGDRAGASVAGVGDMDGDQLSEFVVGARSVDVDDDSWVGMACVVFGREDWSAGTFALSDVGSCFTGEGSNHYAGWASAGVGDADGDEVPDVLIGAHCFDVDGAATNDNTGAAYFISGSGI